MIKEDEINIILIDHQQLFREGVNRVLETESSFNVIVSSDDYSVITTLLPIQKIDVILMDVNILMENMKNIREAIIGKTDIKLIVMSTEGEENYVTEAVKMGVHGYLLKEMDIFSFVDAIKTVKNGISYIHPSVTHDLVEDYRKLSQTGNEDHEEKEVKRPLHLYTKRECEVLQLLTDGQSNRQIAKTLDISEKTVKNHVSSLFKKMNVNDRTQAVVTAIRNQWVEL